MSVVGIGIQVSAGVIEIIKAWNTYQDQHPEMTREEALAGFANGVNSFNDAVEGWHATGAPDPE